MSKPDPSEATSRAREKLEINRAERAKGEPPFAWEDDEVRALLQRVETLETALRAISQEMRAYRSACPGGATIAAIDRWAERMQALAGEEVKREG